MSSCQVLCQSSEEHFGDASIMRKRVPVRGSSQISHHLTLQRTRSSDQASHSQQLQPILSDCDNIINNILEVFRQSPSISRTNQSTTCIAASSKEKFSNHRRTQVSPESRPLSLHASSVCSLPDMADYRFSSQSDSGFCSGDYPQQLNSKEDLDKLSINDLQLRDCGFYYPSLDQTSAMKLLKRAAVGSFLIRDSAQPGYLYSVSVKTELGATSVRVSYVNGLFGFDGDEEKPKLKPRFDSLIALLEYYHLQRGDEGKCITMRGKSDRKPVQITFLKPLKKSPPSLAHLARTKINSSIGSENLYELSISSLPRLSSGDKQFVMDYPYKLWPFLEIWYYTYKIGTFKETETLFEVLIVLTIYYLLLVVVNIISTGLIHRWDHWSFIVLISYHGPQTKQFPITKTIFNPGEHVIIL